MRESFAVMDNALVVTSIFNTRKFEIVDKIPKGFFIWNIGNNMVTDEYIPLCERVRPNDTECFDINTNTLKAIHLDKETVYFLRDISRYGCSSLESCIRKMHDKDSPKEERTNAIKAYNIFIKISED